MVVNVKLDKNMRFIGTARGHDTIFDTKPAVGGDDSAASPMEIFVQALGGCTSMDVISILRKKRKTVEDYNVTIKAARAETHPKKITSVHLIYELKSPDAKIEDLERAVELSQEKYCGVSAMFQDAGSEVTWECKLV